MAYTKTNWSNGEAPAINGTNLNKIEQGIYDATYENGVNVGTSVDDTYKTNILNGKNKLNKDRWINAYIDSAGTFNYENKNALFSFIQVEPNKSYTLSISSNVYFMAISEYDSNKIWIKRNTKYSGNTLTITSSSTTKFIRIQINNDDSTTITQSVIDGLTPQFEKGATATTYEPYITPTINVDGEDIYVKGQNEVYSTAEQRIGTWIDGKPIYRKVFTGTTSSNVSTEIALGFIKNIINVSGYIKIDNEYKTNFNTSFGTSGNNDCRIVQHNNDVIIQTGSVLNNKEYTLCLEYTKTTD